MEQLFWGRLEIDKGTCFFHYLPTSSYARIIAAFKYGAQPEVALTMGRIMAKAVHYPHFFEDIDYLIPVPLSKQRRRKRGYNQSEWLARGVSEVTGIPVCTDLVQRIADNPTQTRMSHLERAKNVEGIFAVNKADGMEGKHLLLIDDVITTGATLIACGTALAAIQDVHISVMTLTMAGK
jgi:ComF family protein